MAKDGSYVRVVRAVEMFCVVFTAKFLHHGLANKLCELPESMSAFNEDFYGVACDRISGQLAVILQRADENVEALVLEVAFD